MNLKENVRKLKKDIPAIFLAIKDVNTPLIAKALAFITVAYALSPVDLIPDFIPVLGYLDDFVLLPFLVFLTIKFIPCDILEKYREESKNLWIDEKPRKWYFAVPIIFIWLIIIFIVYRYFFLIKRPTLKKHSSFNI